MFGTDGVRGLANRYPMDPYTVMKLGQAIGTYFNKHYKQPRVLIGKDTRRSGYMLEQALCSGICAVGVDVGFLGPLPTPGIAYLTRGLRACAGIVISASHNAYQDNGIKIFNYDGYKLPDEVEAELTQLTKSGIDLDTTPTGMGVGRARRIDDAIGQYAVFLKEQFPKHLTLEGLRIVLDCANGSAYKIAPKVFEELGAEIFTTGVNPNGHNINDGCGALFPNKLAETVQLYKADVGLAFDGDADRLIVVDHRGEIVDGDHIMAICAIKKLKEGSLESKTLVSTIMSNMGLDIALNSVGGKVVRTKVGDRYVVEEMCKNNFFLGGEQSGHIIFRDSSTTGDGILAALKLMQVIVEEGRPIHDLKKCMTALPQVLKNITVKQKVPLEDMPNLGKIIKKVETELGTRGRVVFRYSGTENLARIMIEGENRERIEQLAADIGQVTAAEIGKHDG